VRRAAAGLALAAALALAACGQSSPIELPDLAQKPPPGLSSEEQKRAIGAMSERKSTHATEAVKEIEGARPPR
jgi:predicted small lipoprotein YifL